ncbi:MAG TPA: DUF3604 domain-containing protein [Thermodesulfobacteriota bacterium]|nr:DUF3604 domain-containing protein [Thermodesulfobacteriota bacterium]
MKVWYKIVEAWVPIILLICLALPGVSRSEQNLPFKRTETREPCDSFDPLRQPFFGETHVHTNFSFDAFAFSINNDPFDAYAFARFQKELELPPPIPSEPERTARIRKPLDFTAVTDHAELFGEMQICTRSSPDTPGIDSLECQLMREAGLNMPPPDPFNVTAIWSLNPILRNFTARSLVMCEGPGVDCPGAAVSMWLDIQDAAEAFYDRSSECKFTTFVAYEYTAQPSFDNLHRNVIFRNDKVPESPISNVTTGGPFIPVLWQKLREECLEAGTGCDVLTIPHNPNLSGSTREDPAGRMFPDPRSVDEARERAFFEPLVEIIQHKGASECRFDRIARMGVQTVDELCTFEQVLPDTLSTTAPSVPIDEFPTRDMVRNALKDGMALAPNFDGINPFKYGLIGSTDDHNGAPGSTLEPDFQGHGGTNDAPLARMIDKFYLGPGGLAVVWAEENSRDSIFEAMLRKEAYGTSGTRPVVRFFGGWEYDTRPNKLCNQVNRVEIGYEKGVPMGSDLPPLVDGTNPRFLVAAMKDPGYPAVLPGQEPIRGTPLQRIQIVKGWVDSDGVTHEKVVNVAGNANNRAKVKKKTCEPKGAGFKELCTVYEDKDFDPTQPAFYYARVLENPTCRWSTFACKAAGVDPFSRQKKCQRQAAVANAKAVEAGEIEEGDTPFNNCCLNEKNDPFLDQTLQERAWTSPIWYVPEE